MFTRIVSVSQVHASPQRHHAAYIGACTLASLEVFEQSCISATQWKKEGPQSLRKWHMYWTGQNGSAEDGKNQIRSFVAIFVIR